MIILFTLLNVWYKETGPFTGPVYDIAFDAKDSMVLYAGTKDGVWKSMNKGLSWQRIGLKGIEIHVIEVSVNEDGRRTIYCGNHEGSPRLYIRREDGVWEKQFSGINIYDIEVDREFQNRVLIGTGNNTVYGSDDYGITWSAKAEDVDVCSIKQSPESGNIWYFYDNYGDNSGFYRSKDRGETWERLSDGGGGRCFEPQSIYVVSDDTIYKAANGLMRSTDGGYTWNGLNYNILWVEGCVEGNSDERDRFFYFGNLCTYGYLCSGGVEELKGRLTIYREDLYSCMVYILKFSPYNTKDVYLGTDMGLFISRDGGSNWDRVNANFVEPFISQVDRSKGGDIWVATGYYGWPTGVYMKEKGGNEWELRTPRWSTGILKNDFNSIAVDPFDDKRIFAGTAEVAGGQDSVKFAGIYLSEDMGLNWEQVFPCEHPVNVIIFDSNYILSNVGYSTDNGYTWNHWIFEDEKLFFNDLSVYHGDKNIIIGNTYEGVYVSSDSFNKWIKIDKFNSIEWVEIDPYDGGIMYINTYDGAYMSTDTGKGWNKIYDGRGRIFADRYVEGRIYSIIKKEKKDQIWVSEDRGKEWKYVTGGGLPEDIKMNYLYIDKDSLFLCTDRGIYKMNKEEGVGDKSLKSVYMILIKNITKRQIEFEVKYTGYADISIYDIQGGKIGDIYSGYINDKKNITYNWGDLSKGVYFIRAKVGDGVITEKVVKVR